MDVIERLVADLPVKKHSVFQNTKPEILFGIMFPWLQYQVTFGTGKEGLAKWGSKKYVADFYLNKIKGWREEDLCGCTLLFEGSKEEVNKQKKIIYSMAKTYGGLPAGSSNGERGYQMTFLIAYLRYCLIN